MAPIIMTFMCWMWWLVRCILSCVNVSTSVKKDTIASSNKEMEKKKHYLEEESKSVRKKNYLKIIGV